MHTHTGDQIDAQYQEDMQEIVQLAGSPDSAFAMFHDVVKHLFEWDEQGGGVVCVCVWCVRCVCVWCVCGGVCVLCVCVCGVCVCGVCEYVCGGRCV